MIYFIAIKKTKHYIEEHEQNVPWSEIIEVIFRSSKHMKKKGNKLEIDTEKYYVLMELKNKVLDVINAKRKR